MAESRPVPLFLTVALFALSLPANPLAQQAESGPALTCAPGLTLTFHGGAPKQGELLVLELLAEEPLEEVRAAWATHELHFWKDKRNPLRRIALVAVDLALEPELSRLSLTARRPSGESVTCTRLVGVELGDFRTDRLRVSPGFVELSPKDLERTKREFAQLREIWAAVTPERLWDGPFQPPLKKMLPRGNFGRRRVFNDETRSPHTGEDLRGRAGTPVFAPQRGRVVLARKLFFAGNAVILDHGLGLYTLYAHLRAFHVKEGETVETGERLGRIGATGRVTGPHLHWSARLGNARFNPLELLSLEVPGGTPEPRTEP